MDTIQLNDIDITRFGNEINFSGLIWSDSQLSNSFITLFPKINFQHDIVFPLQFMELSLDDWKRLIRQTDIMETEILMNDDGKIKKASYRKTQRQIDGRVQWKVFHRDNYTCRYTGQTGVPLSVDHIDLWENGGATIEENLLAVTKKANRARGSMPYKKWIKSDRYHQMSHNLPADIKQANLALIDQLPELEKKRRYHKRGR